MSRERGIIMRPIDADKIEYDFNIKTYADNRVMITKLLADKDTIDAMPTVEPKTGRWSGVRYDAELGLFVCDNCGKFSLMEYAFCPNCGADMRGEENDS